MGLCIYCHEKAGWFLNTHEWCIKGAQQALADIEQLVRATVIDGRTYATIQPVVESKATGLHLSRESVRSAIKRGWNDGALELASRETITADRHCKLAEIYEDAGLSLRDILSTPGCAAAVHNMSLWAVTNGTPVMTRAPHSFVLRDDELALLLYPHATYCRESSSRRGAYAGVNVPLGNAMSYSIGGYQSHSSHNLEMVDQGHLLVTTKNIYFGGAHTSMRIPFRSVIRFQPCLVKGWESVAFFRDSTTATLEVLILDNRGFKEHEFLARFCAFLTTPEAASMYSDLHRLQCARDLNRV